MSGVQRNVRSVMAKCHGDEMSGDEMSFRRNVWGEMSWAKESWSVARDEMSLPGAKCQGASNVRSPKCHGAKELCQGTKCHFRGRNVIFGASNVWGRNVMGRNVRSYGGC